MTGEHKDASASRSEDVVSRLREFDWYGPPRKGADELLNEAANEIERLRQELEEEKRRSFHHGEIVFRGFGYNVGSQFGIDSLKRAIRKAEFGE